MIDSPTFRSTSGRIALQRGLTLVELMVAMTLALAILSAVTYVYLQGKQGFVVQDNRSRLQENMRLAISLVSRDLEMGGYFGCVKPVVDTNTDPPISTIRITASQPLLTADISALELDGDQAAGTRFLHPGVTIRGYDNGASWPVTSAVSSTRFAGTDTLVVLRGGDDARHLSESSTDTDFKLTSALPRLTTNDQTPPLVISDCTRGEIIKASVKSGGVAFNVANGLNQNTAATDAITNRLRYAPYPTAAMVTTFEPVSYYVALAKGKNGLQVPSLYRLTTQTDTLTTTDVGLWKTSGEVIIEGVESFQVRFFTEGATEGSSLGPFTAAQVTAADKWLSLAAVQIILTLVSDDDSVRTTSTTQTVGGVSVTDNKIRLNTSFTVGVRNPKA